MLNEIGKLCFAIAGASVVLLLIARRAHLIARERNAATTAAFGLFLCGAYAEYAHGSDWLIAIGTGGMMILLAYNNLRFSVDLSAGSGIANRGVQPEHD